jgi:hypothetical protein
MNETQSEIFNVHNWLSRGALDALGNGKSIIWIGEAFAVVIVRNSFSDLFMHQVHLTINSML